MRRDGVRKADLTRRQSLYSFDGHRKESGFIPAVGGRRVRGAPLTDLKRGNTKI